MEPEELVNGVLQASASGPQHASTLIARHGCALTSSPASLVGLGRWVGAFRTGLESRCLGGGAQQVSVTSRLVVPYRQD